MCSNYVNVIGLMSGTSLDGVDLCLVSFEKSNFKKYKIDSLTFALSNNYYAYYVEEYDEIYTKVKDSLELLKKNLDALVIQEEDERRKTDSINNVRKRDSLDLIRNKDSIRLINKTDSRLNIKLKNKIKPKLIEPVSDKAVQSQ